MIDDDHLEIVQHFGSEIGAVTSGPARYTMAHELADELVSWLEYHYDIVKKQNE